MIGTEQTILDRDAVFPHSPQGIAVFSAGCFPIPPDFFSGPAVESASSGYRNVFLLVCIDERRVIHRFVSFEPSEHDRKIVGGSSAESNHCALHNMQVDIRPEVDRPANEPITGGYND